MQCPNDNTTLTMTERQGIEIDYCPACRGVWLGRGELDKLISQGQNNHIPHSEPNRYKETKPYNDEHRTPYRKHRKESFLGELFDF
ncbi:MAG: zf-TFIIB domain-containing protein [bacterium]|nr:zf-TFIIB domain-containing protein [bacterium]